MNTQSPEKRVQHQPGSARQDPWRLPDDFDRPLIPEKTFQILDYPRQEYVLFRAELITWLAEEGKNPRKKQGYAPDTVQRTAYLLDQFYRWIWQEDNFTLAPTHSHADAYLDHKLAQPDLEESSCSKIAKALKRLYRFLDNRDDWDTELRLSSTASSPDECLTLQECRALREAALTLRSVPPRDELSDEERDAVAATLAQRYGVPKEEVGEREWRRARGCKVPSMLWVGLDAGLRSCEMERLTLDMLDLQNGVLRFTAEQASKNNDHWRTPLLPTTTELLDDWLALREDIPRYEGRSEVWLTERGNPYKSQSLNRLLDNLLEEAGIDQSGRDIKWKTLRDTMVTYMTRADDLAAAGTQARHGSQTTTRRYDKAPLEHRRYALKYLGP